jgi:hypothetical protein
VGSLHALTALYVNKPNKHIFAEAYIPPPTEPNRSNLPDIYRPSDPMNQPADTQSVNPVLLSAGTKCPSPTPSKAPISLSFPYTTSSTYQSALLQRHNPRNQESYLILSTSLPYVARCVLTLHTTQPLSNIRLRSQRVHHLQSSKIFTDPACCSCVPTPYTPPRSFTCRRQAKDLRLLLSTEIIIRLPHACDFSTDTK